MQKHILYPFLSSHKKTEMIFKTIAQDDYLQKIMYKMQKIGYKIEFSWFGNVAAYFPKIITLNENDMLWDNLALRYIHNIKAHFSFSKRFGFSYHCHHFIHELIHFEQDLNGEFSIPILRKGQKAQLISCDDYIYNYLHLEAMAAIQAIEISYHLKEDHQCVDAWRGCYYSLNWHKLSKTYQHLRKIGKTQSEAFESCYHIWFMGAQKDYAENIAKKNYLHLKKIILDHNKSVQKEHV